MKKIYLWAKKSNNDNPPKWMSLYQHLVDTKNVAGLLWECWLSTGQRKVITQSIDAMDEMEGKKLISFLAAVHDIGKATPSFQIKKGFNYSEDLDHFLIERLEKQGFTNLSLLKLSNSNATPHALSGQFLLNHYGVEDDISSIIGGHHGKPVDDKTFEEEQLAYEKNYYQITSPSNGVGKKWDEVQRGIFEWALLESGYKKIEDLPKISQPGQVLLLGLLIMADWISSNENYFPLYDLETYSDENSELRLHNGWEAWFKTTPLQLRPCFDIDEIYNRRFSNEHFSFHPRNVQTVFSETIDKIDNPGLIILEAPMGLGKTEAALIGAEQLAYKKDKSGLFIGLPTQATANSMFSRVLPWLCQVSRDVEENVSIQLQHGKANLNEEYLSLSTNINIDNQEDEVMLNQWLAENNSISKVISNKWFSGRKTSMLDDFVVGTVDSFLLSALKQKHLALRHLGFSKKVVIIDEVHAYDAYMSEYLERALEWMGAYDVPVILLSATLASENRSRFVQAYSKGKGVKTSEEMLSTMAYPLITYTEGETIGFIDQFQKMENKSIQIRRLDRRQLFEKLRELLAADGIIGIIVNTVKEAQEIAKKCTELSLELLGEDIVFLLHAGFIATERVEKEKELLRMIGKGADRPNRKIIIGTQVIEQSLDIDVDVMISELAPMDLLIQRMGRLHRHDIKRPQQYKNPVFYVMGTSNEWNFNEGSKFIYDEYLLARTQLKLPDEMRIPDDIPLLVQSVYGDIESLRVPEKIKQMKANFERKKREKQDRASTYLLSEPNLERFEYDDEMVSLIGWLKNTHPNQTEEYGYAQVRDTQETIEVIALRKYDTGYGFFDEPMDISSKLDDDQIIRKMAASTIKLPLILSAYGNADKTIKELEEYNRKYLYMWQEKIWLKGSLGLIFDENGNAEVGGKTLHYSQKYGLSTLEKEDNNG